MSGRRRSAVLPACLALAAGASAGCTNPDVSSVAQRTTGAPTPQNPGEPPAPPPRPPVSQAPRNVRSTQRGALAAFAGLYVNWSYRTLTGEQRTLAAMSVGSARLAEQQAAATSQADSTIRRGRIHNSGQVASIGEDLARRGLWVIVTREQTGGGTQYEGLPASYHVTLAQLAAVRGGYAVSQWLPQN